MNPRRIGHIPPRGGHGSPAAQRGVVLLIAIIMLVVLTLAGLALVRSVDTSNLIGGNMAFREAAVNSGDLGVEAALAALPAYAANPDNNIANQYYATMQLLDGNGVPIGINWDGASSTTANGYTAQYVVERMCATGTPLPITDLIANCIHDPPVGGGSNAMGGSIFQSTTPIYYRVTVRITGPRNTTAYVQATLAL